MAKWIAYAVIGLIVLVALYNVLSDPFGWRKHQLVQAQTQAVEAKGTAAIATGQAAAASDAAVITDKGRARDRATQQTHEANHAAILAAPGASQPLDPRLLDAARRGLCQLSPYADDPACAGLRASDPEVVPDANPRNPAP